jgi:hypothetical protein
MTVAVTTPELDQELETLVPEETTTMALVLQGVVSMDKIPTGDAATYLRVDSAGADAATNIKSLTALFERIIPERYAHWKRATELRAKKLAPFEEVKSKASKLTGAYKQEAERLRLAEESRLQAIENERIRKEQEEQQRLAEAEAQRISQENAVNDAIALEAAGDKKGAEAVLNNPAPVPIYVPQVMPSPVILQKTTPKVAGRSDVAPWTYRVKISPECQGKLGHEPKECSVCLADVPREYLVLNTKYTGQMVKAMKDKFNTVVPGGIEAYQDFGTRYKG